MTFLCVNVPLSHEICMHIIRKLDQHIYNKRNLKLGKKIKKLIVQRILNGTSLAIIIDKQYLSHTIFDKVVANVIKCSKKIVIYFVN